MYLKSNHYPRIEYEKGEEIFLAPEEFGGSFYFDVEEELTVNDEAMNIVASTIDEVDILVETAKDFLKKILSDEENEYYGTVTYFMEFHRDEPDAETIKIFFIGLNFLRFCKTGIVFFIYLLAKCLICVCSQAVWLYGKQGREKLSYVADES